MVNVLVRTAAIFNVLADGEATVAQIAEAAEERRSTVYRLLDTLRALGFVQPGQRKGSYTLGFELMRLGSRLAEQLDVWQVSQAVLDRLNAATGHTLFVCIRSGDSAVCIDHRPGRRVRAMVLEVGGTLPLHVGAAPSILLAYQPSDVIAAYCGALDTTSDALDELTERLTCIRERGYSASDQEIEFGIGALGAPIFDRNGDVVASVSLCGPTVAILGEQEATCRELLLESTAEISKALGHGGERMTRYGTS